MALGTDMLRAHGWTPERRRRLALACAWSATVACMVINLALVLTLGRQVDALARFAWTTGTVIENSDRGALAYQYSVRGETRRGSRPEFAPVLGAARAQARARDVYTMQASVPVAYDPWFPSRSVLRTQVRGAHVVWLLPAWALHAGALLAWQLARRKHSGVATLIEDQTSATLELERPRASTAFACWSGAIAALAFLACVVIASLEPSLSLAGACLAMAGVCGGLGVARLWRRRVRGEHRVVIDKSARTVAFPSRLCASLRTRTLRTHDLERWDVCRDGGGWALRIVAHGSNHVRPGVITRADAPEPLDALALRLGAITNAPTMLSGRSPAANTLAPTPAQPSITQPSLSRNDQVSDAA
jgi:hypothetical protein